jgi:hypothetical protein
MSPKSLEDIPEDPGIPDVGRNGRKLSIRVSVSLRVDDSTCDFFGLTRSHSGILTSFHIHIAISPAVIGKSHASPMLPSFTDPSFISCRIRMSFRRPKAKYRRRTSAVQGASSMQASPERTLISLADAPVTKRPRHSSDVFLPGPEPLLACPGRVNLTQTLASHGRSPSPPQDDAVPDVEDVFLDTTDQLADDRSVVVARRERQRRKRAQQYTNWVTNIIPSLIEPHLRLLRQTNSLRDPLQPEPLTCTCAPEASRSLHVISVHFHRQYIFCAFIFVS